MTATIIACPSPRKRGEGRCRSRLPIWKLHVLTRSSHPGLRSRHAAHRPQRPGRAGRWRADHGAPRLRLYRASVLERVQRRRRAGPQEPEAGELHPGRCEYLERPPANQRRPAACHQRQGRVRRRRLRRREELLQGLGRCRARHGRPCNRAQLDGRAFGVRHRRRRQPEADRIHAGFGRDPPHLVYGRTLGLHVGPARRLFGLHLHHGRHERPDAARAKRGGSGFPA